MLKELGMEGKPSLDKCEAIKKERELKAELDSLDTSLILDTETKGGRSTRLRNKAQSRPSYAIDIETSEEEEEEEEEGDEGEGESKTKKSDGDDDNNSNEQEEEGEEDESSGV
jgi:hypothetical protein